MPGSPPERRGCPSCSRMRQPGRPRQEPASRTGAGPAALRGRAAGAVPDRARGIPHAALCQRMERSHPELFTFVADPAVPPINNAAERALRPLVVGRKISGGTRSPQGSPTRMVLQSVIATWEVRSLDPLGRDADPAPRPAHAHHRIGPSLNSYVRSHPLTERVPSSSLRAITHHTGDRPFGARSSPRRAWMSGLVVVPLAS